MIRTAKEEDAERLLEIYSYYVKNTAVSFEYDVPPREEFARRIRTTLQKYPYLVCERDGRIVGYAYAGPFHTREAYSRSAETSIYVDRDEKRTGIGKELYGALEEYLSMQHIVNLYAGIAYSDAEDGRLTHDSVHFHEHLGYHTVAKYNDCGYKFGGWYDVIYMEKFLSPHESSPEPVLTFSEVSGIQTSTLKGQ